MKSRHNKPDANQFEIDFPSRGGSEVAPGTALLRAGLPSAFSKDPAGPILPSQIVYQDCVQFPLRPAKGSAVRSPAELKERFSMISFNPESLDPDRFAYQAATYVQCLESPGNVLIWGKTGSGKTHLAITCCGGTLSRNLRAIVFNPSAAAFHEQVQKARKITGFAADQIAVVSGTVSAKKREQVLNNQNIRLIFATPGSVDNDIAAGRFDLQTGNIGAVVLDEAHHLRGNHNLARLGDKVVEAGVKAYVLTATPAAEDGELADLVTRLNIQTKAHLDWVSPIKLEIPCRVRLDQDMLGLSGRLEVGAFEVQRCLADACGSSVALLNRAANRLLTQTDVGMVLRVLEGMKRDPANADWVFTAFSNAHALNHILELRSTLTTGGRFTFLAKALGNVLESQRELESHGDFKARVFVRDLYGRSPITPLVKEAFVACAAGTSFDVAADSAALSRFRADHDIADHDLTGLQKVIIKNAIQEMSSRHAVANAPDHPKETLLFSILEDYLEHDRRGGVVILVGAKDLVDYARYLTQRIESRFQDKGARVALAAGQGHMSAREREKSIVALASGEIDFLVGTSTLWESLDLDSSIAVLMSPISNPKYAEQALGRVGRRGMALVYYLIGEGTIDNWRYTEATRGRKKMHEMLHTAMERGIVFPKIGPDIPVE